MTVQEAICKWVESYQEKQFKLHVAGAIVCFLGSLLVLTITYWVLSFLLWFTIGTYLGKGIALVLATLVAIGLLFCIYLLVNHEELDHLDVVDDKKTRDFRTSFQNAGRKIMSHFANPEAIRNIVRMLDVSILAAPATLFLGFRHARAASSVQKIQPEFVAPFLIQLAKAGKRVPMEKLAEKLEKSSIADLITQMSLIDGVTVRTQGANGMYLSEELKADLMRARNERKKPE